MITSRVDKRKFLNKLQEKQNYKKEQKEFLKKFAILVKTNGLISTLNHIYYKKKSDLKKIQDLLDLYIEENYNSNNIKPSKYFKINNDTFEKYNIHDEDKMLKIIEDSKHKHKDKLKVESFIKTMCFLHQFKKMSREDYMKIQYDFYELGIILIESLYTFGGE